jgi:hypothetical protein
MQFSESFLPQWCRFFYSFPNIDCYVSCQASSHYVLVTSTRGDSYQAYAGLKR